MTLGVILPRPEVLMHTYVKRGQRRLPWVPGEGAGNQITWCGMSIANSFDNSESLQTSPRGLCSVWQKEVRNLSWEQSTEHLKAVQLSYVARDGADMPRANVRHRQKSRSWWFDWTPLLAGKWWQEPSVGSSSHEVGYFSPKVHRPSLFILFFGNTFWENF